MDFVIIAIAGIVIWRVFALIELVLKRFYVIEDRSYTDSRLNAMEAKIESFPAQVSLTSSSYNDLNERFQKISKEFNDLKNQPIDTKELNEIKNRLGTVENKLAFKRG